MKRYLKFISKATNQHGIHSPFIYSLVTQCIYKKSSKKIIDFSKQYKQIEKESVLKTKTISHKQGLLFNRVIQHLNIQNVLVIGTGLGYSTVMFCKNHKNVKVNGITTLKNRMDFCINQFKKQNINHQVTLQSSVNNNLPTLHKNYDLVFFDENYINTSIFDLFTNCLKTKHNNTVFVFNNIHRSDEMELVWEKIKNHTEVKVTVDLYQCGWVFFRREQEKQHFKVRF